jgi:peptidoglycan hydrolase CwlO-like protein
MKKIVLIILTCLLASSVLAFLANYFIYTPILENFAVKISGQQDEMSRLAQFNLDLEQTLANQGFLISSQQTRISTLETEKSDLQIELEKAEAAISSLEAELSDREKE